ncbi:MAG: hypothetical protein AAGK05_01930, partial [Pseudomonadota bacterium]
MEQVGIYEQLITQVIEQNLDRKQFYVGERQLEPAEAAICSLNRFLEWGIALIACATSFPKNR